MQSKDRNWMLPGWFRRIGIGLAWCLAFLVVMVLINALGFFFSGKVEHWQAWANARSNLLLAWRLLLYAAIAAGWIRIRRRILMRETDPESHQDAQWRLSRLELTCIVVIALTEASQMMKGAV